MGFLALRLELAAAEAERLADALLSAGALSVDASDRYAGTDRENPVYDEPDLTSAGLWPTTRLVALFPEEADVIAALWHAADEAELAAVPFHEIDRIADEDWVRKTQAQFEPLQIAGKLWVVPTWSSPVDPSAINVILDPGLAFGTGSHATTRLCLQWLAAHLRTGETLLDYGCGSGILAIAAARLGARDVVGVDIDAQAVDASRRNAVQNEVSVKFVSANPPLMERFDVVVANILAKPLQMLAPLLADRVRGGGCIVLSGILARQAATVAESYAEWFSMAEWAHDDGWVALAGVRNKLPGSAPGSALSRG